MERCLALEIDDDQRDALLGAGGTGLIAFPAGEDTAPHAIPVSYGYNSQNQTFYFRLAQSSDSAKPPLDGAAVTFVTYGESDGWWSVIAQGKLEDIEGVEDATAELDQLHHVDIPIMDVFPADESEMMFEYVRLVPDEMTARMESPSGD
jgi:nitroimidazol reductase NimA-like FMN-containing flavoprotein (pyridoxamine 5'-phosphate oxidase superfamily)